MKMKDDKRLDHQIEDLMDRAAVKVEDNLARISS